MMRPTNTKPAGHDEGGAEGARGKARRSRAGPAPAAELRAPTSLIARASAELASALELDEALRSVASIVVPAAADWYAVHLVTDDGGIEHVAMEHRDPTALDRVRALEERYPPDPDGWYGVARVIRTGRTEMIQDIDDELLASAARGEEHLALLRDLRLSSSVVVPLMARGRVLGAMTFVYGGSGRRYDDQARLFLEDLAGRTALTLDNIRLIAELKGQAAKLARALLRAEEEHREKSALLASTAEGIYGLDRHGRCTFLNAAGARMLLLDPGQALGQNMHQLIHHSRRNGQPYPEEECPIYRAFRQGEQVRVDDDVLWRSDGSWFPASYSSSPLVRDGEVVGAVVAFADQSARRAAEGRSQLLGRILDESLNEIYIFDAESLCFVQVNRGGRENLGYEMDELARMTPVDLKPEFTPERFAALLEPLRAGEREALRFETVHRRQDGSTYPVEVSLQLSHSGERPLFVAVMLDISHRRGAEQERELLIRRLQEANEVKAEFVSTMSHELRTPLNAVIGYTQLLEAGIPDTVPDGASTHVHRIGLSARHLMELIDEILTFSKLEAGREVVAPSPVDLPALIDEVEAVMDPLAAEKGIAFSASAGGLSGPLVTDPKKLRQILLNLTGNAVKFTEQGEVELTAIRHDHKTVFRISDTGIGMSSEEQVKAFEPFWQADRGRTRMVVGTGLGLAISRRFVEILGGELHLSSKPGCGTVFTISLPDLG